MEVINLNPSPPTLKGLPKIHKENTPIRPIVNWKNAPAYRLAKLVSDTINRDLPLPYSFNIPNSVQLMNDLKEIPINEFTTFASFDIADMYTNIPTQKLPPVIKDICNQTHTPRRFRNELTTLVQTVLKQNYFQFQEQNYIQTKGLAMGAPSSSTLSEIYLQHLEHKLLYKILLTHNILGYFRYVDESL